MDDKPKLRSVEVFPVKHGRETLVCIRDATGLSDRVITGSMGIVHVLELLDGEHTILDIQAELTRRQGSVVMSDNVRRMLEVLDEAFLLEGERFAAYHHRLHEEFADAPVRKATSAGNGYPDTADELAKFLDGILAKAEDVPTGERRGVIAPHIDYVRGWQSYAAAFAALGATEPADCAVIIGTSHAETTERFALTRKNFETPFGCATTDVEAVDALLDQSGHDLLADEFVHRGEHSIELELVWVQHLCRKAGRETTIVPILCGGFREALVEDKSPEDLPGVSAFVDALRELVSSTDRRVTVVVGADLAHVGPRFGGDTQVSDAALRDLERIDRETLAFVEAGDADGFFEFVSRDENARNICSVAPIWLALKALAPVRVDLLGYEQWCDDEGMSCVTFAAGVFR